MSNNSHGFPTLPLELLHDICRISTRAEIRNLRLTCRRISAVADEYLLGPVLELYYASESVQLAHCIAARPEIARGVRMVCFHADRLNGRTAPGNEESTERCCGLLPPADYPSYCAPIKRGLFLSSWSMYSMLYPGSPLRIAPERWWKKLLDFGKVKKAMLEAPQDLHENYEHYLRVYAEQENLDRHRSLQAAWVALFEACPNLRDVIVTAGDALAPTTTYRVHDFRKALSFPKSDPDTLHSCVHALNSVVLAAHHTGKTLRMLGAGRVALEFFMQHDVENNERLVEARNWVFASLQKFILQLESPMKLNLQPGDEEKYLHRVLHNPVNKQIPQLLGRAEHLQDLIIVLPGRNENGKISLSAILGEHPRWPSLRSVRIDWCKTDEEYLVSFLLRHQRTLTHLHLIDIDLFTGSWINVFQQLAGRLTALVDVKLRGVLGNEDGALPRCYGLPGMDTMRPWALQNSMSTEALMRLQQYVMYGNGAYLPPLPDGRRWGHADLEDGIEDYLMYWVRN